MDPALLPPCQQGVRSFRSLPFPPSSEVLPDLSACWNSASLQTLRFSSRRKKPVGFMSCVSFTRAGFMLLEKLEILEEQLGFQRDRNLWDDSV